jgi:hypothetical protein
MAQGVTVLERAFQLARSGLCGSVSEIRERLKAEGYSLDQLTGPTLSKQLFGLIQEARGGKAPNTLRLDPAAEQKTAP